MAGVVLESVSRVYPGGVEAVKRIDLEVRDREFLVLVGPSGCGKTTTLRLIAGLEELSGGKITIGERIVNDVPPKDRDIAMVFQNYALYPHMNVYRNMAFGLELREKTGGWRWLLRWVLPAGQKSELAKRRFSMAERIHATARTLGIENLLDRLPRQLSGGERQRVALGRAIVRNPAVFLFDEPLSNLDAKLRVEMRRELKQLHARLKTTMIYVTHDQVEALTLGERIVVMNEGTVQQIGPPMEVYDWPANRFVAGFIGTPAMNFIDGELVRGTDGAWKFRRGDWVVPLTERLEMQEGDVVPALLGVRPEDVRVTGRATGHQGAREGIEAVVELVEMLGDSTITTVVIPAGGASYGEHKEELAYVITKSDSRVAWRAGDRVYVQVNEKRVHAFDRHTGVNYVCGPRKARVLES